MITPYKMDRKYTFVLCCLVFLFTQCQSDNNNKPLDTEIQNDEPELESTALTVSSGALDSAFQDKRILEAINSRPQTDIDADIDTSLFKKRFRLICTSKSIFDLGNNIIEGLDKSLVNVNLLRQLLLCKVNDSIEEYAYHMPLENCNHVNLDLRIFTLDKDQKDSSVLLVYINEGDTYEEKITFDAGVFLVFNKQGNSYKIKDIGFRRLAAFDCDKNNKLYPIFFGWSNLGDRDKMTGWGETRLKWDGNHLVAHEVVMLREDWNYMNFLTPKTIKKNKFYKSCANRFLGGSEIQKGVKIHWREGSRSLKLRNNSKCTRRNFFRDTIWTRGFKID
jgi:hypothetical protein